MAHILAKQYSSWYHHITLRDLLRYTAIAVIAILGIAGLLQSIAGTSNIEAANTLQKSPTSVYGQ